MVPLFHDDRQQLRRTRSCLILVLVWVSGLLAGTYLFSLAGHSFSSPMHRILSGSMSIVSLLGVTVLPFLFSAFAVYISKPWILYLICFGKALVFSCVSLAVWISFGSAGWLVRFLLMFSDLISLPLLFWYWLRHISGEHGFSASELLLCASIFLLIGSIDYCCISPFLAMLYF